MAEPPTASDPRSAASAVAEQTIRELSDELVALRERCKELEGCLRMKETATGAWANGCSQTQARAEKTEAERDAARSVIERVRKWREHWGLMCEGTADAMFGELEAILRVTP